MAQGALITSLGIRVANVSQRPLKALFIICPHGPLGSHLPVLQRKAWRGLVDCHIIQRALDCFYHLSKDLQIGHSPDLRWWQATVAQIKQPGVARFGADPKEQIVAAALRSAQYGERQL